MQVSDAAPSVPSPAKVADKAQDAAKAIPSPSETASAVTGASSPINVPSPQKVCSQLVSCLLGPRCAC